MEAPPPPPPPPPPPLDAFEDEKSRLSGLPTELQDVIKSKVRDLRARELCRQISLVEAPPLFLSLVMKFIRDAEQGELNPHAVYDIRPASSNNTCLQFVEIRCMHVVSRMYNLIHPDKPATIPPELDDLRKLMIRKLAIQRKMKNKKVLRTLRDNDNSSVEELIYSIKHVADLSYTVLKTSIYTDATFESALALTDKCCDQFIEIIRRNIRPDLKEKAKKLLMTMLKNLHSISQDEDHLSESIRAIYRIMYGKVEQEQQEQWWSQQGGKMSKSFKKQLKNNSNRRASKKRNIKNKNSIRKNKKIKKKTLRLRNNK
jgi:hypothetical protein